MRKKIWIIILTVLVFLSGTMLGISAVYRVKDVTVNVSYVTAEARAAGEQLQTELEEIYKNDATFFADEDKARAVLAKYPYFQLSDFEKSYPKRLVISVVENAEMYAIEKEQGKKYFILSSDGTLLEVRENYVNLLNGKENILLKGLDVEAELGNLPTGDGCFNVMLTMCQSFSKKLDGAQRNVTAVEVLRRSPQWLFKVTMREGVAIYFHAPAVLTEEKVTEAVRVYQSLKQEEKLTGRIYISENEGAVLSQYSPIDEFIN